MSKYIEATTFGQLPIGAHFVLSADQGKLPSPWREISPDAENVYCKVSADKRRPLLCDELMDKHTHELEAVLVVHISLFRRPNGELYGHAAHFSKEHREAASATFRDAVRSIRQNALPDVESLIRVESSIFAYQHGAGRVENYDAAADESGKSANGPAPLPEQLQDIVSEVAKVKAEAEQKILQTAAGKMARAMALVDEAVKNLVRDSGGKPQSIDDVQRAVDAAVRDVLTSDYRAVVRPKPDWTGVMVTVERVRPEQEAGGAPATPPRP